MKREVTRIVTPGTAMNAQVLRSHENNYLAAIHPVGHPSRTRARRRLHRRISRHRNRPRRDLRRSRNIERPRSSGPRPALPIGSLPENRRRRRGSSRSDYAARSLCDHFHLLALDGCGLEGRPLAIGASAAILHYLRETQRTALDHLERPAFYDRAEALVLDATTVRNLELVEPLFAGESKDSTLLYVLDRTRTGMGGRLLRRRLLAPSIDTAEIEARLDALEELQGNTILRAELAKDLSTILDLERLLAKVTLSAAGPRDLAALSAFVGRDPVSQTTARHQRKARGCKTFWPASTKLPKFAIES